MKILIITDIHYGTDTNYPEYGGENYTNSYGSQFERYLPKIKKLILEHDLIINLGDLIAETNTESDLVQYKKAIELFGKEKPIKHVIGNHELRTLSRNQITEIIGENKPYYSFDLNNYHHVILDSFRNSTKEQHRIDEEQLAWLKEDLKNTKLLTLVYCHYALDNQFIDSNYYFKGKPQKVFIENKEKLRKIFEDLGKVVAVFGGHLHFFHQEIINGIKYITAPAFTENDGNHKPKAECLSIELDNKKLTTTIVKID